MAAIVRDGVINITDHITGTIRQIKVKRYYWLGETIRWAYNDIDEDEDADIRDAIAERDRIELVERATLAALDEELEKMVLEEEKKVEIKEKMVLEEDQKKVVINTAEDIDTDDDPVNDAEEYEAWKSRQIAAKLKMEMMVEEERKVAANTQEDVDTVDTDDEDVDTDDEDGVNESDDTRDDEA